MTMSDVSDSDVDIDIDIVIDIAVGIAVNLIFIIHQNIATHTPSSPEPWCV